MNTVTVNVNLLSTLPLYACLFTGMLMAFLAPPMQHRLQQAAMANPTFAWHIVGSRVGSALLLLAAGFGLMMIEVMILVPLTGGSFA